jgi:flagellar protein FliO/FliZ
METVTLVGRLLVSLGVVLGLMWVISRRLRNRGKVGKPGQIVEVLSRQNLSRTSSVAVVRVLDQALIIGITDGQINLIGETELSAVQAMTGTPPARPSRASRSNHRAPARTLTQPTRPKPSAEIPVTASDTGGVSVDEIAAALKGGRLAGSALSPTTWRQTIDAMRDMTVRTR